MGLTFTVQGIALRQWRFGLTVTNRRASFFLSFFFRKDVFFLTSFLHSFFVQHTSPEGNGCYELCDVETTLVERMREVLKTVDWVAPEAFFIGNFDHLVSLSFACFHLKSHHLFLFCFVCIFSFSINAFFALTAPMQCSSLAGCGDACMYAQHFGGWGRRISSSRPAWAPYWSSVSQSSHFLCGGVCCTKMNAKIIFFWKHIFISKKKKKMSISTLVS